MSKWVKVGKLTIGGDLPKFNEIVAVAGKRGGKHYVGAAYLHGIGPKGAHWVCLHAGYNYGTLSVSHWCPLPTPPK